MKLNEKQLEQKLNKEYKELGNAQIKSVSLQNVDITTINYVESIMDKIKPIKLNEPVILQKDNTNDKYFIIDGYHRIKNYIEKEEKTIRAYIIESTIERSVDGLFKFFKNLIGKEIKFINTHTFEVGDRIYEIIENEGCGGCSNGWSEFDIDKKYIGRKITIEKVEERNEGKDYCNNCNDCYELFINDKKFADVDDGWGNGYYGGDFEIKLI